MNVHDINEYEAGGKDWTDVVRPDRIDLLDIVAKRRRFVYNKLQEIVRCGFSGQELKLLVDCMCPGDDDSCRNLPGVSEQGLLKTRQEGDNDRAESCRVLDVR